MKEIQSIAKLEEQSTWRLLGLGIITFCIYFAHYIKRQTIRINEIVDDEKKISLGFVNAIIALSYASLFCLALYLMADEGQAIEKIGDRLGDGIDKVINIMLIVWGFKARNRLNEFYAIPKGSSQWFHGFGTFLFSPLYFNYKINSICHDLETAGQISPNDSTSL